MTNTYINTSKLEQASNPLRSYLTVFINDADNDYLRDLYIDVVNSLIDHCNGDTYSFQSHLNYIVNYGCVTGAVGSLIYHSDCIEFAKSHLWAITDLIDEYMEDIGEPPFNNKSASFGYSWWAWFAYETVCYKLQTFLEEQEAEEFE